MISITFAVGHENFVSILNHPDRNHKTNADIDALYKEIDAGCPRIRNYNLFPGIFEGCFSKDSDKLRGLRRIHGQGKAVA